MEELWTLYTLQVMQVATEVCIQLDNCIGQHFTKPKEHLYFSIMIKPVMIVSPLHGCHKTVSHWKD